MNLCRRSLWSLGFILCVAPSVAAGQRVDYLRDIKPLLATHCVACHGPQKQRGGLRLDTAAGVRQGGNSGPAVIPGKSGQSLLIHAVTGTNEARPMPPEGPRLSTAQVDLLKTWIDEGALAPEESTVAESATPRSTHWAFQAPKRPPVPGVRNHSWVRNPIDAFILAELEKRGLTPSPEADRITLLRRVSLDLIGLPPTIDEVDRALSDDSPDWYERVVDRLLQSPHYGERWGRHWLDQARYADSNGFTIDSARSIWKYRDWVIDAFNRDLPFDQFTIEQLAGDLLPNATLEQKVATGFHRNTLKNEEGGIDVEQFRVESVVDRVNTTGAVFLGLTIGCCQCHDHKYDPFTQREYYQLFAFLNNADEPTLPLATPEQLRLDQQIKARLKVLEKDLKALDTTTLAKADKWTKTLTESERAKLPGWLREIVELPENGRTEQQNRLLWSAYRKLDQLRHVVGTLSGVGPFQALVQMEVIRQRQELERQIDELKAQEPNIVTTLVMQERTNPRMTNVLIQGDFTRKGVEVKPGVPAVLHPLRGPAKNRLDLARWIVDPANPLTPRVTVNRFWQAFFGIGLVETENDFGTQGTPPSHPDLLDWLATEFIARQWSMKAMHRLIVTSATYRQASKHRPELLTVDPRNRLLARQNRLRLEAEVVRDVALSASGLLTPRIGGPSVFPPQPDGVYRFTQVNKNWQASIGPDRYRRGMYTFFWRSAPHPALTVFDAPDANSTCTRRNRSNTPLQALTLLNDQGFVEMAQGLARRVLKDAPPSDSQRLRYAFRVCLARPPRDAEEQRLQELLAQQRASFAGAPDDARALISGPTKPDEDIVELAAWTSVARVLLNLDEFITRE
ncbi:MAG: PSD1 and planctomycete cytochrome C domain-containing protein [Gemmataceae bacterium]|nr:PSD1 and planctomycete cytochrome C domain-containing protein [Gemmataceae bacterium]MDW8266085.1 PSD1 and planctomycete cytochrome C domain-containing protein [Gemmataceae bacterium]